jgi:secretion/DNA translocation related TadE-like protein
VSVRARVAGSWRLAHPGRDRGERSRHAPLPDRGWAAGEHGAGSALALAVATAALLLAMLVVGTGTAAIAQARAAAAADAAALAAADALAGFADGSPCSLAQAVATASDAGLAECRIGGLEARVTATVPVGALTASVTARAGPPR